MDENNSNSLNIVLPQEDNFQPHDNSQDFNFSEEELTSSFSTVEIYKKKLKEYQAALTQRDEFIQKLQGKFEECMKERNIMEEELKIKSVEFANEFEHLQVQLKKSINSLKNNSLEHEVLQSQLHEKQEQCFQYKEIVEKLEKDLKSKDDAQKETSQKYELLRKAHSDSKNRHLLKLNTEKKKLEKEYTEEMNKLSLSYQNKMQEKEAQSAENLKEIHELKTELSKVIEENKYLKEKIDHETDSYKLKMNDMISQIAEKNNIIEKLNIENEHHIIEEKKEQEKLREELREQHKKEVEFLKKDHMEKVSLLAEKIDSLERVQKEDQKKFLEAVREVHEERTKEKTQLKDERDTNIKLLNKLEENRLVISDLESKCSLLDLEVKTEKETSQSRLRVLNESLENKEHLEAKISLLENEIRNNLHNQNEKDKELASVLKELQEEKKSKNEINIKIKELTLKNEFLVKELENSKHNFAKILEKYNESEVENKKLKQTLKFTIEEKTLFEETLKQCKKEISCLLTRLENLEIEKKTLSDEYSELQIKFENKVSSSETQISNLSQDIKLYKSCLEKYKEECHSLNEKLFKLCHNIDIKENSSSETDIIRACSISNEQCEPISLLTSQVSFLSEKLEENESLTSELNSLLEERNFFKEEYDKLKVKLNEQEHQLLTENDKNNSSLSTIQYKNCGSCTKSISTRDQGFQTCIDQNSSGLLATKTIEEEYVYEQIFIVPQTLSSRGSISLENLKEIGSGENARDNTIPTDYEQLKSKCSESLFAVKSLQNENALLRQALKFKRSAADEYNKAKLSNDNIGEKEEHMPEKVLISEFNSKNDNHKEDFIQENDLLSQSHKFSSTPLHIQEKQTSETREKTEENNIPFEAYNSEREKELLSTQLQLQIQFNETLKEELQMLQTNLSLHSNDCFEEYLRKGIELFIKAQHPFLNGKGDCISSIFNSWKRIFSESEGKTESLSRNTTKDEEEKETNLKRLLIEVKNLIDEQKKSYTVLKDVENKIVSSLESNMQVVVQSFVAKEDSLALLEYESAFGKSRNNDLVTGDARDILKEFEDITNSIMDSNQEEKTKLLQNQKFILNILEENQTKINEIFKKHFNNLKNNLSVEDIESVLKTIAQNVDSSLNEESVMIDNMYKELLTQYSHEESLHSQSHSLTLNEFKSRLSLHLQQANVQLSEQLTTNNSLYERNIGSYYNSHYSFEMSSGSFNNVDLWKRLISTLSQVILNLLHYYTISQKFANDDPDTHLPESLPSCGGCAVRFGPTTSLDDSEEENSLKMEIDGRSLNGGILNVLDTTGASEGMLDDFERNEQVKEILTSSYPNFARVLKGNYDHLAIANLEKEVQEFIISLQASTGMLRVFMLSKDDQSTSGSSPLQQPSKVEQEASLIIDSIEQKSDDVMKLVDKQIINEKDLYGKVQEFSLSDLTPVKPNIVPVDTQLADLKLKLNEEKKVKEDIQIKLHQIEGLYAGLVEENKILKNDFKQKEDQINYLIKQLEEKTKLEKKERDSKTYENVDDNKNKKQHREKSIKEKVKAMLSARDKGALNQNELVDRVRDLEDILEETVTERDKSLEALTLRIDDLSQQLDSADRLLRSNKQFFEQQAAERDQEMEELMRANEKLRSQLRERENLISQHSGLQREVQMLEKELKDNYASLEEERSKIDEKENDLSAALQKIRDLKDDLHSLEMQLSMKCSENESILRRLDNLQEDLQQSKDQNVRAQNELDILSKKVQYNPSSRETINLTPSEELNHNQSNSQPFLVKQVSISEEIENTKRDLQCQTSLEEYEHTSVSPEEKKSDTFQNYSLKVADTALIGSLIDRLEKSTLGLESLQFTTMSGSVASDEELSVRDQLQMSGIHGKENRSLSPSSAEAKLEEKFLAFERIVEAAAKYTKDLDMRYCNLKVEYDELLNEKEALHEHLSKLSSIKSELDKASKESEFLRKDFDKKVLSLSEQLSLSRKKEKDLEEKCKSLQYEFSVKEGEMKSIIAGERKCFEKEKFGFKKEKTEFQKNSKQLLEEIEMYRKQNSEQLIKISSLEARLEDLKRSDSPHEFELKIKINSLKDDLEKCREELTLKFREVEELRYSVKELKEQLILREGQIDNLSRQREHQSLPESSSDSQIHKLAQALEEAQEKFQNMKKKMQDLSSFSSEVLSLFLEDKDAAIKKLPVEQKRLIRFSNVAFENPQNLRLLHEIVKNLKEDSKVSEHRSLTSDGQLDQEIQRSVSRFSTNEFEVKDLTENDVEDRICAVKESIVPSVTSEDKSSDYSPRTFKFESVRSTEESNEVCQRMHVKKPSDARQSKKLEADYEAAQELLESNEQELKTLVAEAEDCVPLPSTNDGQMSDLLSENDELRKRIDTLQNQLQEQETLLKNVSNIEKNMHDHLAKNEELLKAKENLECKIPYLEAQLEEKQNRIEKLKQELELRNKESYDLSTRMELIITQLKDSDNKYKKQIKTLERDHFTEMQDMKEKHIEREKQLCNEYEERLTTQLGHLAFKFSREKEEALKNYQIQLEELLTKLSNQKQNEQNGKENHKDELEASVTLDDSFIAYLEKGGIGSRESSVFSEGRDEKGSVPDEDRNPCSRRLRSLIRKVNKEGIQVLTQSEKLFLQNHQDILQENLNNQDHQEILPGDVNLHKLCLENKKKIEVLEFTLDLEKSLNEEFQTILLRKTQEVEDLRRQLAEERSHNFSLVSESNNARSQNTLLVHFRQELQEARESVKSLEKQNEELDKALKDERENFNLLSSTLDHERKLTASRNDHHNYIIKDLRNCLEKEKTRTYTLMNEVYELKSKNCNLSFVKTFQNSSLGSLPDIRVERDRKHALVLEKEAELRKEIDCLQMTIQTMSDERTYERNRYLKDIHEFRLQIEQLESALSLTESKKNSLFIELQNKDAIIRELKTKIKLNDKEMELKENQNQVKTAFRSYDEFMEKKMKQKDLEIDALSHKVSNLDRELQLHKSKIQSLSTKDSENNNDLPRIKNVGEFLQTQHRQYVELCRSVAELTEERHLLRQKILRLEGVIDDLNSQLQERPLIREDMNDKHVHIAEKTALAAEVSALKLALKQSETKYGKLIKELNSQELKDTNHLELAQKREEISVRYFQWKLNRSESYRRALIWQKHFLIHMLNCCQDKTKLNESPEKNLQVNVDPLEKYQQTKIKLNLLSRFRSGVFTVIALRRMKFFVNKWQLGKKLKSANENLFTYNRSPSPIIPSAVRNETPMMINHESSVRSNRPRSPPQTSEISPLLQITSFTPPTKDVSTVRKRTPGFDSRNLFGSRNEEKEVDEYIERLDYIHTQLGLPKSIAKSKVKEFKE